VIGPPDEVVGVSALFGVQEGSADSFPPLC